MLAVGPCFLLPVLPIIGWCFSGTGRFARAADRCRRTGAAYYVVAGSSIAGALLSVIFVRTNVIHFAYLVPVLYLVLAWVLDAGDIGGGVVRAMRPILVLGVIVTFTATGMALLIANRNAQSVIETRRGEVRVSWPDEVIGYTQAHVPAGERIFVYPYFPLAYYLTATFSATRYEYLQPGMHTREQDQEAIGELERAEPTSSFSSLRFTTRFRRLGQTRRWLRLRSIRWRTTFLATTTVAPPSRAARIRISSSCCATASLAPPGPPRRRGIDALL